jgi:hypothetical protein
MFEVKATRHYEEPFQGLYGLVYSTTYNLSANGEAPYYETEGGAKAAVRLLCLKHEDNDMVAFKAYRVGDREPLPFLPLEAFLDDEIPF